MPFIFKKPEWERPPDQKTQNVPVRFLKPAACNIQRATRPSPFCGFAGEFEDFQNRKIVGREPFGSGLKLGI
jgi:hypothetical protein